MMVLLPQGKDDMRKDIGQGKVLLLMVEKLVDGVNLLLAL
jgi:hypothetical protein